MNSRNLKATLSKQLSRLRHLLRKLLPMSVSYTIWYQALYRRDRARCEAVLAQQKPDILILAEDNVEYRTPIWIKAAHQRGIPVAIIPFTIANANEPAEAYRNRREYSADWWVNRFFARRYPHWVYEHKGHKMVRMPGPAILINERLGLTPPMPWILHSGEADAIAVESDAMRDYYLREGFPQEQLVSTGALYDDVLAEHLQAAAARRADLCHNLGLSPEKPILLCALPPDQTPLRQGICDFSTYRDLVAFWMDTLATCTDHHHVIVNLHPRLDAAAMQYIERWGVRIAPQNIAALVPLCDLFVASVSATIRMAIACGIPVINYDVYRYGYTDYAGAGGVLTLEEQVEFQQAVQRLTGDPAYYAEVKARQEQDMAYWGRLDGQAGARMLQLFDRLVAEAQASRR